MTWRMRLAHLASPWKWRSSAFAALVVGVLVVSVAALVSAPTGPMFVPAKLVSVGLASVAVYLVYLRPLFRSLQRRRTTSR